MQGERDRFATRMVHLERALSEMTARTEELKRHNDDKTKKAHQLEVPHLTSHE